MLIIIIIIIIIIIVVVVVIIIITIIIIIIIIIIIVFQHRFCCKKGFSQQYACFHILICLIMIDYSSLGEEDTSAGLTECGSYFHLYWSSTVVEYNKSLPSIPSLC